LRPGDVIVGFGSVPIASIDDLHRLLTREAIDVTTGLVVLRGVVRVDLVVTPNEAAA